MFLFNFFKRPQALAAIRGNGNAPRLGGEVKFFKAENGVLVVADIIGLPDNNPYGFFGFHIHSGTSCTGDNFSDTGSHFDKLKEAHPRHSGDLPPLLYCGGSAFLAVLTDRFTVEDIIGRTVVIHSHPDDFMTNPSGNSGTKIACGVIKRGF